MINGRVSEYCKCWCRYNWEGTTWKASSLAIKAASEPFFRYPPPRLGIYEQQVGDQSCCWQTLQTQRFIQLIKNCCNVFSAAPYLGVYLYRWGFINCQWARWETAWLSSSGPNSYRGCDDRIQSATWLLSGIQMPIPLPSTISAFSLSFVTSPSLFPPLSPCVCQGWWLAVTLCRSR